MDFGLGAVRAEAQPYPHEPAPAEPRRLVPERPLLIRGVALAGLALGAAWGAVQVGRSSWLLTPVSALLGASALLAGWAAAIQLTGGEKFDDHPWV